MRLDIPLYKKKKKPKLPLFLLVLGLVIGVFMLYQLPSVRHQLDWRMDIAWTYLHGIIDPVKPLPTPLPAASVDLSSPAPSNTSTITASPTTQSLVLTTAAPIEAAKITLPLPSPTPLPGRTGLRAPAFVLQDWNNCGPATLAMNLNFYGWQGSQFDISDIIKPMRNDRNVNPEEMVEYVHSQTSFHTLVRVGGEINLLRLLIANGFPVIVEETFHFAENYWLNDDRWAAHYLLITAYDDTTRTFTVQNSFVGANQRISYDELEQNWHPFNYVYMLVYPPDLETTLQGLLGEDYDVERNRRRALALSRAEIEVNPDNAFSWFNLGSNLVFYEDYPQAADAYDTARRLGLPQRMLRYQFGPFHAYFQSGRFDDLLALAQYALDRTPTSEEAMLWYGWALYRNGQYDVAQQAFHDAIKLRPGYVDAEYALNYVLNN